MSCLSVQAELIALSMFLYQFLCLSSMWNGFQDPQETPKSKMLKFLI